MANKTYVEARKHFQLDSHLPSFQASCVGVSSDILLHRACICRQYLNSSAGFFSFPRVLKFHFTTARSPLILINKKEWSKWLPVIYINL